MSEKGDGKRRRYTRLTMELAHLVRKDYDDDQTAGKVAEKWGMDIRTVNRAIVMAGGRVRTTSETQHLNTVAKICQRLFSDEQEATMATEYDGGATLSQLATRYGVTIPCIAKALDRQGMPRRHRYCTCTLNDAVFDGSPTNHQAMYFAGLLYADGCISDTDPGSRSVILSLNASDECMVFAFRQFIGSSHAVSYHIDTKSYGKRKTRMCRLSVRSDRLADDLHRYGVTPRKSLTATAPDHVRWNRDWWRGVIDGDGWVSADKTGRLFLGVCGSRHTCESFREYAMNFTSSKASVVPQRSIWWYRVSGCAAAQMANVLYTDCTVALPRKQQQALKHIASGERMGWLPVNPLTTPY